MSHTKKRDRRSSQRRGWAPAPPQAEAVERGKIGNDAEAIRQFAQRVTSGRVSVSGRLIAADAFSEAAVLEHNPDRALEDFAKANDTYGRIMQAEQNAHGLLLYHGVKAAVQKAFIPSRQQLKLTGSLPTVPARNHASRGLLDLSGQLHQQWGSIFTTHTSLEDRERSSLAGAVSEHLCLSLLLRYGQQQLLRSDGTPDTTWMVLPTTSADGHPRITKTRGARSNWDISIFTELVPEVPPTLDQKIQVFTGRPYADFADGITTLSLNDDVIKPYNEGDSASPTTLINTRMILDFLLKEGSSAVDTFPTRTLDTLTDHVLDAL